MAINEKSLANLKKFSTFNQPVRNGKKPSKLKKYIKDSDIGREDVSLMIKNVLFQKSYNELEKLLSDKDTPMVIRLFIKAYITDFKNGALVNFNVLMDRAFGAPKQDITLNGNITVATMTYEQRKEIIDEYIKERSSYVQGGGQPADRSDCGVPGEFEEVEQEEPGEAESEDT